MIWAIFAVLTGIAVLSILWPLARRPRAASPLADDVAFYRAQLEEIARDGAATGLSGDEIAAAKAEAGRRLLAAAERDGAKPAESSRLKLRVVTVVALVGVPLVALELYDRLGHPSWPDEPLEARMNAPPDHLDLAAAIAKVEAHLRQHPEDARGYDVLIPIYMRLGRAEDAVETARAALQHLGETPQRLATYGETLVNAARGQVTEEARGVFEKVAAQDPALPEAQFYLGLAAEQKGDKAKAKAIWEKLLAQAPKDAPWRDDITARIAALSQPPAAAPEVPAGGAAIAALPPAERAQVIRGMVERLAQRLNENGHDLDGWLRLMRAYMVLKDVDKARAALGAARKNFDGDPAGRARIDALARELGLES